jgi:AraC family transcriptional activator of pyochelin receptor
MPPTPRQPALESAMGECVVVSPEMTALIGHPPSATIPLPAHPMALIFNDGARPSLRLEADPRLDALDRLAAVSGQLILLVDRRAVSRIGGQGLIDSNHASFHLPRELRAIVMALQEPPASAEARTTYRLAKSIELLCETIRLFAARELISLTTDSALSPADARRVMFAREMIDNRWSEKLTLDAIARASGLNRAKLTRAFREMFDCTIAEALAERRLVEASKLLLTTDLPVSSVGYESGYLNNAAFSRAFGRHFGRSPSHYRAYGMAA